MGSTPVETAPQERASARPPQNLGGQRIRVSQDTEQTFVAGALGVLAPVASDDTWRNERLDSRTLDRMSPAEVLKLLTDVSPDVSRALWDFLRLTNPGYTATAMRLSGSSPAPQTVQAALKTLIATLGDRHGGFDVVIGRLWFGAFLRGAFMAELVLDQAGRQPLDLATPDPQSARFKQMSDPDLGAIWQLGQWQSGQWVALNRETIRYVPIDPFPGSPYGRSLANPALFPCLFLIALLHDLRRVVQQQGYPRIDLKIIIEKLRESMPENAQDDPEAFLTWLNSAVDQIKSQYARLQPDDAYVHPDIVEVGRPVGTVDSSSLGAVKDLIMALERQAMRALKTLPLLMGMAEGTSEANANRQWEIYSAGLKALQHLCEGLLEKLLSLAMQAQGLACTVQFRFAELRAAEMLRDAQTEQLRIKNAREKYNAGWISQDAAAQEVTGHDADAPAPRSSGNAGSAADAMDVEADPGSNRDVRPIGPS